MFDFGKGWLCCTQNFTGEVYKNEGFYAILTAIYDNKKMVTADNKHSPGLWWKTGKTRIHFPTILFFLRLYRVNPVKRWILDAWIFFNNCMQLIFHVACLYVRLSVSGVILMEWTVESLWPTFFDLHVFKRRSIGFRLSREKNIYRIKTILYHCGPANVLPTYKDQVLFSWQRWSYAANGLCQSARGCNKK